MKLKANQQAACSRLFSSSVFRELASKGKSSLFAHLIKQTFIPENSNVNSKVSDAFDAAFDMLRAIEFRDEYIYKAALTHKVLLGRHSLHTASMLTEFRVEDCKADLVIFNGTATVYEIKSERDSLARLSKQIDAYRKVFASVYVISGENHISSVINSTPLDVGVLQLSKRHQISTIRPAIDSPGRLCPITVLDTLRTEEAMMVLSLLDITKPSVPNTLLRAKLREVFKSIPARTLHSAFVSTLKQTRNLSALTNLVGTLPPSLQTVALATPLRKGDHLRLLSALNTRMDEAIHWA